MYGIDDNKPEPLSMMDWLITMIVAAIPVLGIVMLLFWAFAKDIDPNKQNWSRAALVFAVLFTALWFAMLKPMFFSPVATPVPTP